jgi:hypothetical protein
VFPSDIGSVPPKVVLQQVGSYLGIPAVALMHRGRQLVTPKLSIYLSQIATGGKRLV